MCNLDEMKSLTDKKNNQCVLICDQNLSEPSADICQILLCKKQAKCSEGLFPVFLNCYGCLYFVTPSTFLRVIIYCILY